MDFCVAAAGVLKPDTPCLEYPGDEFSEVMNVNVSGVLYTAQAAGRYCIQELDICSINELIFPQTNGKIEDSRKHRPHCIDERESHEQRARMGCVQHI